MTNLLFLVLAFALAAVGIFVLWVRTRRPRSVGSGVDSFARQMKAIAPDRETDDRQQRRP